MKWKLTVEDANGTLTVIESDGRTVVYQRDTSINRQHHSNGVNCAATSASPPSIRVVEIPRSLDVKDKSQGMAGSSNPHNANCEASTQSKTSKNKANHGKRKPSRKEKARRAAQQLKAG
jgi:hypothetical protein